MKYLIAIISLILSSCDLKYFNEAEALAEQQKYEQSNALLDKAIEKDQGL